MTLRSAFQYCQSRVRQHDYENYLCTLALPAAHRPAALALRAFNVETASALGAVKEPHLALVRLRWWRDAVAAVHRADDDVPDHPVAVALAAVLRGGRGGARTRRWMNAIVDARVRDAESASPPLGVPYLEAYADATASSLLYLILDLCEVRHADADHAAAHLGKAIGIANLLRGTKAHAAQRRSYIPLDVAAKHGAATEDVYRAKPTEGVRNAVHEVASVAKAHLDSARAMAPRLRADRLPPARERDREGGVVTRRRRGRVPRRARGARFRSVPSRTRAREPAARHASAHRVGRVQGAVLRRWYGRRRRSFFMMVRRNRTDGRGWTHAGVRGPATNTRVCPSRPRECEIGFLLD